MNYCPHCGKPLRICEPEFCTKCCETPSSEQAPETAMEKDRRQREKRHKVTRKHGKEYSGVQEPSVHRRQEEAYDGYYDDIIPEDADRVRQGIDREMVKRIAGIACGMMLIICACVAIMYLL